MDREAIDAAVATVAHCDSIAPLLLLAGEIAGSNVALFARISDNVWTVCAAHEISAVGVGNRLTVGQPVRARLGLMGLTIAFSEQVSYGTSSASAIAYRVAAPVVLANGRFFGVLCALDPTASNRVGDRIESKFKCLSSIVASQIDQLERRDQEKTAFLDEKSAGQLREQFIAILGHDLRTPLHAIFASSDALARQLVSPAHAQIAGRIKTHAQRMASLIDDVLDFARGRLGGGISVELTEVENIDAGLMTVVQELRRAYSGREFEQDLRAVLASFRVGQSQWLGTGPAYLLADCAGSPGPDICNLEPRKRHAIYRAIAVKFPACLRFSAAHGGCGVPPERQRANLRAALEVRRP